MAERTGLDHWNDFRQRVITTLGADLNAIHAVGVLEGTAIRNEHAAALLLEHLVSAQSEMQRASKELYEANVELRRTRIVRDAALARVDELEEKLEEYEGSCPEE